MLSLKYLLSTVSIYLSVSPISFMNSLFSAINSLLNSYTLLIMQYSCNAGFFSLYCFLRLDLMGCCRDLILSASIFLNWCLMYLITYS